MRPLVSLRKFVRNRSWSEFSKIAFLLALIVAIPIGRLITAGMYKELDAQRETSASFKKFFVRYKPPDPAAYSERDSGYAVYSQRDEERENRNPTPKIGRVTILTWDGSLSTLHFLLPEPMRPQAPDQTDTICWMIPRPDLQVTRSGLFETRRNFYPWDAVLIDHKDGMILRRLFMNGSYPHEAESYDKQGLITRLSEIAAARQ